MEREVYFPHVKAHSQKVYACGTLIWRLSLDVRMELLLCLTCIVGHVLVLSTGPVTCLSVGVLLVVSQIISSLSSDQRVATLRSTDFAAGIRTSCINPCSHLVFAGTTVGHTYCWDIRTMKSLWTT